MRLLTNAHWPSLLHSLVRVMLRMLRDSLFTLKHKHTNYTHIHTEFALSSNGIHSYSFIHQLMPISARRSCLETNAVFSFDTGTDNSLGKRATSSIYLSMYNSSFSKASVLVAMYAFYLKHYVYTGAQARRGRIELTHTHTHTLRQFFQFFAPARLSLFMKLSS